MLEEIASIGLVRAIFCLVSADGKALVFKAAASHKDVPFGKHRRPLSLTPFTQKTLTQGVPIRYSLSERQVYRGKPLWELLGLESPHTWLEVPIVRPLAPWGVVYAAGDSTTSSLITTSLRHSVEAIVGAFADHSKNLVDLQEKEALLRAEKSLIDLDRSISRELSQTFNDPEPSLQRLFELLANNIVAIAGPEACDISLDIGGIYSPVAQAGSLSMIGQPIAVTEEMLAHSVTLQAVGRRVPAYFIGKRSGLIWEAMQTAVQDTDNAKLLAKMRAWGAFPIILGESVPGAISVASTDWDFFVPWRKHVLELSAEKAGLMLTVDRLVKETAARLKSKEEEVRRLSVAISEVSSRSGFAEAARTVLHNLGNLLTPLGSDVAKIRKWARGAKVNPPQRVLDDMEGRLQSVEEVFDFYRRLRSGSVERKANSINALAREALEFCRYRAETYSIGVQLKEAPGDPQVECSDVDLLQAFINIILNSIEAMIEPGISVRRLQIRISADESHALLRFEDSGIGIKERDRSRVWEPDFTTKREKGGTGLGLPHVKRAVGACGGEVVVESKYRKGTTVSVFLPLGESK